MDLVFFIFKKCTRAIFYVYDISDHRMFLHIHLFLEFRCTRKDISFNAFAGHEILTTYFTYVKNVLNQSCQI